MLTKSTVCLWDELKNCLNTNLVDENNHVVELRRKDIIERLTNQLPYIVSRIYRQNNVGMFSMNTFTSYMRYLVKAGYLYKPRRGVYGLVMKIPNHLTLSDAKSLAYGYLTPLQFTEKIENIDYHKDFYQKKNWKGSKIVRRGYFQPEEFSII